MISSMFRRVLAHAECETMSIACSVGAGSFSLGSVAFALHQVEPWLQAMHRNLLTPHFKDEIPTGIMGLSINCLVVNAMRRSKP